MAPQDCKKCGIQIKDKQKLKCINCGGFYHVECSNVAYKRYYLMTPENRQSWKCDTCWSEHRKNIDNNSTENVTQRKKIIVNISTENSFESLSESFSDTYAEITESLNRSCPDLRRIPGEDTVEMKIKMENLERKLKMAENEIESLLSENYKLQNKIKEHEKKIHKLTHICSSDIKKKRRKSLNKAKINYTGNESFQENILNKNISNNLNSQIETSSEIFQSDLPNTSTINNSTIHQLIRPALDGVDSSKTCVEGTYRVHIFGDDQGRGVCKQLQRIFGGKYKIMSEIKPGATTDRVLEGILSTCSNYGKLDYILIITGSNDRDPVKLSSYLYYYLSQLSTTNIILCETSRNKYLNTSQINGVLEKISQQLSNVNYVDLRYSYLGVPQNNLKHVCQNILQEVLRFNYRHRMTERCIELAFKLNKGKPGYTENKVICSSTQATNEPPENIHQLFR